MRMRSFIIAERKWNEREIIKLIMNKKEKFLKSLSPPILFNEIVYNVREYS